MQKLNGPRYQHTGQSKLAVCEIGIFNIFKRAHIGLKHLLHFQPNNNGTIDRRFAHIGDFELSFSALSIFRSSISLNDVQGFG